jgi:hypothetical protein
MTEVTVGGFTPTGHHYRFRDNGTAGVEMIIEASDTVGTPIATSTIGGDTATSCTDTCQNAEDDECDEFGKGGIAGSGCLDGTDCTDCGPWQEPIGLGGFSFTRDGVCLYGGAGGYGRRADPEVTEIGDVTWWADPPATLYAGRCGEALTKIIDGHWFSIGTDFVHWTEKATGLTGIPGSVRSPGPEVSGFAFQPVPLRTPLLLTFRALYCKACGSYRDGDDPSKAGHEVLTDGFGWDDAGTPRPLFERADFVHLTSLGVGASYVTVGDRILRL